MKGFLSTLSKRMSTDRLSTDLDQLNLDGSLSFEQALRDAASEGEISDPMIQMWEVAKKTLGQPCREPKRKEREDDWVVVRVFVSSTFTDMHQERERLVSDVFPGLRQYCKSKQLHLMYTDLRWGVPQDTTAPVTIETCLSELDRCKRDNGFPIFLWLGGDRYGWVPSCPGDVSDSFRKHWGWVPGMSITAMEVLEGALRSNNPRALFAIRNPAFINSEPFRELGLATRARFTDVQWEDGQATEKPNEHYNSMQNQLKKEVRDAFAQRGQVLEYDVSVDGKDSQGFPILDGLDKLVIWAKQKLQRIIDEVAKDTQVQTNHAHGEVGKAARQVLAERSPHSRIVSEIRPVFAGREQLIQQLLNPQSLSTAPPPSPAAAEAEADKTGAADAPQTERSHVVLLEGGEGVGKTALVARLADRAEQEGHYAIYHFVGAAPLSEKVVHVVERLDREVRFMFNLDPQQDKSASNSQAEDSESDFHSKCDALHSALAQANASLLELAKSKASAKADNKNTVASTKNSVPQPKGPHSRLFVLIDGLDLLAAAQEVSGQINALINRAPLERVVWVLCGLPGSHTESLVEGFGATTLAIKDLEKSELTQAISKNLAVWNKVLHPTQMELLMSKSQNMLWVSLACHKLLRFGVFEKVTELIAELPSDVGELHSLVFDWLDTRHAPRHVRTVFGLLAVAFTGLTEMELVDLMAIASKDDNGEDTGSDDDNKAVSSSAPPVAMHWAQLYNDIAFLLHDLGDSGNGTVDFLHESTRRAAANRFLAENKEFETTLRRQLASYLLRNSSAHRIASEVPSQLAEIGNLTILRNVLTSPSVLSSFMTRSMVHELMGHWRVFDENYATAATAYRDRVDELIPQTIDPEIHTDLDTSYCLNAGNLLDTMGQPEASAYVFGAGIRATESLLAARPHVQHLTDSARLYTSSLGSPDRMAVWRVNSMVANCGRLCLVTASWKAALDHYQHSLEILEFLKDDPEYWAVLANTKEAFAAALLNLEQIDEALKYLEEVLDIMKTLPHFELKCAGVLLNVGLAYRRKGMLEQSKQTYEQALELHLTHHGEMHEDVVDLLLNLSTVHFHMGDFEGAVPFLERGLGIAITLLGKNHFKVAMLLDNLAIAELNQPNPPIERVLNRTLQALEILSEIFGDTSFHLQTGLRVLGDIFSRLRMYEKVDEVYKWQLRVQEANNIETDRTKMMILANRISMCKNQAIEAASTGNLDEAKVLFDQVLQDTRSAFGDQLGPISTALVNCGVVRSQLGDNASAVEYLQQAHELAVQCFGEAHAETTRIAQLLQTAQSSSDPL